MNKWIDADHLRKWILSWWERTEPTSEYLKGGDILNQIDREPSIEIICCGECKWYNCGACFRDDGTNNGRKPDDFCSYGERAEQTEPQFDKDINVRSKDKQNCSEKPNNCEWSVEYAKEMLDTMPCEECGHWEHGAGDHYYCALLAMRQKCYFELKGESTYMFANKPKEEPDEMCRGCKHWEKCSKEEWRECRYEAKDEPQTEAKRGCTHCKDKADCPDAFTEVSQYCGAYEQTDCAWK